MLFKGLLSAIFAISALAMPIIAQAQGSCAQELLLSENVVSLSIDYLSAEAERFGLWHVLEVAAGRKGLYADDIAKSFNKQGPLRSIANSRRNHRRPRPYDGTAHKGLTPHQMYMQKQRQARKKLIKQLGLVGAISALGAGLWSVFSSKANGATRDELFEETTDMILESRRIYDTGSVTIIDTPIEDLEELLTQSTTIEVLQTVCRRPSISDDIVTLAIAYSQNSIRIQKILASN